MNSRPRSRVRLGLGRGPEAANGSRPVAPWWLIAAIGGIAIALAGLVLVAGLMVLGWAVTPSATVWDVLGSAPQWWLLAHGAPVTIGGVAVSVVPWGFTLVAMAALAQASASAARAGVRSRQVSRWQVARDVVAVAAGGYLSVVVVACLLTAGPAQLLGAALMSVPLLTVTTAVAAILGAEARTPRPLAAWVLAIPRAVGVSVLVVFAGGAAALAALLISRWRFIVAVEEALDPGLVGGGLLAAGQALWLPTLIVWASAYALGSPVSLGPDSVVSLTNTHVGLMPGLPIFGAVPADAAAATAPLAWLVLGIVAGVAGAATLVRSVPWIRVDHAGLGGAITGLLAAGIIVALAWASRGDLGIDRLTGMGPDLAQLAAMSAALLGLSGMGAGLAWGWWSQRSASPGDD